MLAKDKVQKKPEVVKESEFMKDLVKQSQVEDIRGSSKPVIAGNIDKIIKE